MRKMYPVQNEQYCTLLQLSKVGGSVKLSLEISLILYMGKTAERLRHKALEPVKW